MTRNEGAQAGAVAEGLRAAGAMDSLFLHANSASAHEGRTELQ
jgi:hypothetical protein